MDGLWITPLIIKPLPQELSVILEEKMKNNKIAFHLPFCILLPLLLSALQSLSAAAAAADNEDALRKTYIVRVHASMNVGPQLLLKSFLLTTASAENSELPRWIYSYKNIISGYAARLTDKEVKYISTLKGFVSVHPDRVFHTQTTHTPEFLGLVQDGSSSGSWSGLGGGGDGVVIGIIDTGIFPDHPSFSGAGMPPPPSKWKGRCDFNASQCNNKLIGARTFLGGEAAEMGRAPPIDEFGHGTHTASTAAGAMVADAQLLGNAKGAAVGIAPRAHLAIYKVCREDACQASDILAAMDAAVEDGVDVLSISLGSGSVPFFQDLLAVGAYRATEKGIFVSCAAGNEGPGASTVSNVAPWILTVAASNTDRVILSTVKLGNGLNFSGQSSYQPNNFSQEQLPLIYAGAGPNPNASFCLNGTLDGLDVKGKMVLCDRKGGRARTAMGLVVKAAGGAGMIIANQQSNGQTTMADLHFLPASHISYLDGLKMKAYINSSQTPTASIVFMGTETGHPAPVMSSFSSRGPSLVIPDLLKPDITGPGLNILAAWPSSTGSPTKNSFNILSGTSMSTPHLSGIAALIKSAHPSWSPMAIKSAIMTTAETLDRLGRPILDERNLPASHFALGSGHVNPVKAVNPGLIYDLDFGDYKAYLCGLNYNSSNIQLVTGKMVDCSKIKSITGVDLNYPSISVSLRWGEGNVTVWRTVKNVGEAGVDYLVKVEINDVLVVAEPSMLRFEKVEEEKRFSLTFARSVRESGVAEGRIKLVSSKYEVSSPISVTFKP